MDSGLHFLSLIILLNVAGATIALLIARGTSPAARERAVRRILLTLLLVLASGILAFAQGLPVPVRLVANGVILVLLCRNAVSTLRSLRVRSGDGELS